MKPRYDESPLLRKAVELEQRLDRVIKAQPDCPKCKGGKLNKMGQCMKMDCVGTMGKADMATKDKYCMKNFGKKYSECSEKQKAQCDKAHGKMAKAEPGFKAEKITDINPAFYAESGGQTKSGYFTTNGRTIETEDAPKKKKPKEAIDTQRLGSRMNPHEGRGAEREDTAGER